MGGDPRVLWTLAHSEDSLGLISSHQAPARILPAFAGNISQGLPERSTLPGDVLDSRKEELVAMER